MRTQEEIVERLRSIEKEDMFGFGQGVLLSFLDFEHVKPFLVEEATKEKWDAEAPSREEEGVKKAAKDYLTFAWGKAQDHRGLSAGRSVTKMTEYIWLLGMEETLKKISATGYPYYGCPILKVISEALEYPLPTDEALVNMMEGKPCVTDCREGCHS